MGWFFFSLSVFLGSIDFRCGFVGFASFVVLVVLVVFLALACTAGSSPGPGP